jgi:hypothetical protein
MTTVLERGKWSAARPGRTLPPAKTRYPLYRRLGGPQGRSERAENLVPTGIRSRTVQPVAQSLYRLSYPAHESHFRSSKFVIQGLVIKIRDFFFLLVQGHSQTSTDNIKFRVFLGKYDVNYIKFCNTKWMWSNFFNHFRKQI